MQTCDVLIVGAGIAGASAAYEIAPFARVILLERERQPGYHSTGRSAAVFAPGYGNRVIRALTKASRRFYEQRMGGLAEHPVLAPRAPCSSRAPISWRPWMRSRPRPRPSFPPSSAWIGTGWWLASRRSAPTTSPVACTIRPPWTSTSPRSIRAI